MNLKKSTDELKTINDNTLTELEEKDLLIKKLNKVVGNREFEQPSKNNDDIDTLKRENSILATQLREMQEELAEN
jgi:hypothetical protein